MKKNQFSFAKFFCHAVKGKKGKIKVQDTWIQTPIGLRLFLLGKKYLKIWWDQYYKKQKMYL